MAKRPWPDADEGAASQTSRLYSLCVLQLVCCVWKSSIIETVAKRWEFHARHMIPELVPAQVIARVALAAAERFPHRA